MINTSSKNTIISQIKRAAQQGQLDAYLQKMLKVAPLTISREELEI